jgi:SAM-dependent methyltransferase
MTAGSIVRRWAKRSLVRVLPRYGYELVPVSGGHDLVLGNVAADDLIICNFCGTVFRRSGHDHSEFLNCPHCDAIARERVVYQCILDALERLTGVTALFVRGAAALDRLTLLECSPRPSENRRRIYEATLRRYRASDYDLQAHRADVRVDLTDAEQIGPLSGSFDIIICAHILEHIPDYVAALRHLHRLLAPGGFVVLQVPILEAGYVSVTWDEFHQDNSRVYHRFGFDLVHALDRCFSRVIPVVGLLDFEATSPEIKPDKYEFLRTLRNRVAVLGRDRMRYNGLGSPDLCDAFVAYK